MTKKITHSEVRLLREDDNCMIVFSFFFSIFYSHHRWELPDKLPAHYLGRRNINNINIFYKYVRK